MALGGRDPRRRRRTGTRTAILGSITWFFALGFGARHLGRWLRTARAWRILDTVIAVLLVVMGVLLVLPVFTG